MSWARDRDRLTTWALTSFAALSFSAGAWQFSSLANEVKALRAEVQAIAVKAALVEAARYGDQIKDLEERLRAIEIGRK